MRAKTEVARQRRRLENEDYKFIRQEPYQMVVNVDGQEVRLPFTNAYFEVALKKDGYGVWHYMSRWDWCRRDVYFEDWCKTLSVTQGNKDGT